LVGFLLWGFFGEFICIAAGGLYPMYASFKSLEDGDQEEVNMWLMYWVTYAVLVLAEALLYRLFCWIPFYHVMRLLLVVWLMTRGARGAYTWLVSPILRRYRPSIDGALVRSADEIPRALAGKSNEKLRRAFGNAAAAASAHCRGNGCAEKETDGMGGIQDWVAQELAKEAASCLHRVAAVCAAGALQAPPPHPPKQLPKGASGFVGARARTASPRPACLQPVQLESAEDSKSN